MEVNKLKHHTLQKHCNIGRLIENIGYFSDDDLYYLYYVFGIGGYPSSEKIIVQIRSDMSVKEHTHYHLGEFSGYLDSVSLRSVEEAARRLEEKMADKGGSNSGIRLEMDSEGYLCLTVELIVHVDPSEQDETVDGDHRHYNYSERISKVK